MSAPTVPVRLMRLEHSIGLPLPEYQTSGAAGMDIRAAVRSPLSIAPGATVAVPTGLAFALPPGFEIQIRPRSGIAKQGSLIIPNAPGTIDEDYRGEAMVLMRNIGTTDVVIERGMRIAQAVLSPVVRAAWTEVDGLDETPRSGGFGSTGSH